MSQDEIKVESVKKDVVKNDVAESNNFLSRAKLVEIKSPAQYTHAVDTVKEINAKVKELEKKRRAITQPMDKAKKEVMDLFRTPLEALEEAKKIFNRALVVFNDEQEKKRKAAQAKADAEAAEKARKEKERLEARAEKAEEKGQTEKAEVLREQAESAAPFGPVVPTQAPAPKGLHYRTTYEGIVVDKTKVPLEYLEVNMSLVNKVLNASKGQLQITGIKVKENKTPITRG